MSHRCCSAEPRGHYLSQCPARAVRAGVVSEEAIAAILTAAPANGGPPAPAMPRLQRRFRARLLLAPRGPFMSGKAGPAWPRNNGGAA